MSKKTSPPPPPQQSGVSGDGGDGLRAQLHRLIIENRDESGIIPIIDQSAMADEIMRLIDAQFDAGLEAAEGALPEKRERMENEVMPPVEWYEYVDRPQYSQADLDIAIDEVTDAARQQIRALRRGKVE